MVGSVQQLTTKYMLGYFMAKESSKSATEHNYAHNQRTAY